MKVCLIKPPSASSPTGVGQDACLPLGLAYIAGSIKQSGFDLQVIDAVGEAITQYACINIGRKIIIHGLTFEELISKIHNNTVIGVSCMFSNSWLSDRVLLEKIRDKYPEAIIVVGGEHATALPEYILEDCKAVDIVILGEGEETFVEMLKTIESNSDLEQVKGIIYKDKTTGKIHKTDRRPPIKDIDLIPKPAWSYFNVEDYVSHALTHGVNLGPTMAMLMTRGCPHECTFCSCPNMWTKHWRSRTPSLIIEEMKEYIERYNVTNFDFYDLSAIVNREWIKEFCNLLIKENLNITWQLPSGVRSEIIDFEIARLIYKSGGIRAVGYAPETGSRSEQKRLKKNVSIDVILNSMRASYKAGLHTKANLVFGFPGQTWKDIIATAGFVVKLAWIGLIEIAPFPYSPYPGSAIFKQLLEQGKVEVNDVYFQNLLSINDPIQTVSYSDRFSSKTLKLIILFMLCTFYFFNFLFRPYRFFILLYQILSGDTSTRITYSIANVRKRWVVMKLLKKSRVSVVTIPHLYKPAKYKEKRTTVRDV